MAKELNYKGISLNKLNILNNEHEQKIKELKKELNDKEISLNEYKKGLSTLNSTHEKELKKEIKKVKNILIVMRKIKLK